MHRKSNPAAINGPIPLLIHITGSCEKVIMPPASQAWYLEKYPATAANARERGYQSVP